MLAGDSKSLFPSWKDMNYFCLPVWHFAFSAMCLDVMEGNTLLGSQKNHLGLWLQNEARHRSSRPWVHGRPA